MSIFRRHLSLALTILLFAVGCSHSTPTAATVTDTKPDGARLSQAQAVRIAAEAATKQGYHLTDYKDPQAHYEFTRKDRTWSIFYDGKVPMPGHHFLVWVDDRNGETRVMPGA